MLDRLRGVGPGGRTELARRNGDGPAGKRVSTKSSRALRWQPRDSGRRPGEIQVMRILQLSDLDPRELPEKGSG